MIEVYSLEVSCILGSMRHMQQSSYTVGEGGIVKICETQNTFMIDLTPDKQGRRRVMFINKDRYYKYYVTYND